MVDGGGSVSDIDGLPRDYPNQPQGGYALSGKIMLTAIVILFVVVIIMVCLHLYARWYLLRARRRHLHNRNRRRTHLVFYVDPNNPSATVTVPATQGLDASVLKSLPVFVYSSETQPESLECAVCLSEFEENEKGRMLPKCNHSFHIDCIDMWFHSHSTCPLCRSPVEPAGINQNEVVVTVNEPVDTTTEEEAGSSSGLCSTCCKHDEEGGTNWRRWASSSSSSTARAAGTSSSFGARRKSLEMRGVSIEVPRRNESFGRSDDEFMTESPASQSYKSPGNRIRSLKRILSRGLSPSSGGAAAGTSCGSATTGSDFDLERGRDESTQRSRVQTPR